MKNNNEYDFTVETSIMPKFWFQENPIQILCIFDSNRYILVKLWVKVFVSQGWVLAKIEMHTL